MPTFKTRSGAAASRTVGAVRLCRLMIMLRELQAATLEDKLSAPSKQALH